MPVRRNLVLGAGKSADGLGPTNEPTLILIGIWDQELYFCFLRFAARAGHLLISGLVDFLLSSWDAVVIPCSLLCEYTRLGLLFQEVILLPSARENLVFYCKRGSDAETWLRARWWFTRLDSCCRKGIM